MIDIEITIKATVVTGSVEEAKRIAAKNFIVTEVKGESGVPLGSILDAEHKVKINGEDHLNTLPRE